MSNYYNQIDAQSATYTAPGQQRGAPNIRDTYTQSTMLAGAETVMPLEKVFMMLNLPGPEATVRLDQAVKVHKLRIERVWFTIPASQAPPTAPGDSTLYLTIEEISHSSNIVKSNSINSINNGIRHVYDGKLEQYPLPNQINFPNGDPGVAPPYISSKCVFVFPVFVPTAAIAVDTLVVAENKSDLEHNFIGRANGFQNLRIVLWNRVISTVAGVPDVWQPWSTINTNMTPGQTFPVVINPENAVRIFIEAHMWVEKRH